MSSTFFNPSVGNPGEICEFVAKSNAGLKVHRKAKHKDGDKITTNLDNSIKCLTCWCLPYVWGIDESF